MEEKNRDRKKEEKRRPNLVYVFADQLRYASVGYNGDELAITPRIDGLSRECEIMDNAISGHPVCSAYRATLMTGKYTAARDGTGMVINEIRLNPHHHCLGQVLTENGYDTSYIGKWHIYAAQLGHHYDVKNSFIPPGEMRLGFDGYFAAYNFHHEYYAPHAYYHLDTDEKIYCSKYEPDEQTDMAIARLREHGKSDKPFALFVSYGTVHDPWSTDNVPKEYLDLFEGVDFPNPPNYKPHNDPHADGWARFLPGKRKELPEWRRVYYAMTANLDYNVGRLWDALCAEGLADDTIFIFTSDHGEMFGAQGRHAKNIFYDEAARVPFLIRYGDRLPKGKNETCFNSVDIMPTLLTLLGLPVPEEVQGVSVADCILSGSTKENNCLMQGTGPTAMYGNGREWRALRTPQYTYATYRSDGSEYLFDNLADPYQMKNRIKDPGYADLKKALKDEMYGKMDRIGDHFESNRYYEHHWVKDRKILEHLE